MVVAIGDQYASPRVQGQAIGEVELGVRTKAPIALRARDPSAGNGVDGSVGTEAANRAPESGRSREQHGAKGIHQNAKGCVDAGVGGGAVVAGKARLAIARRGLDNAIR